MTTKLFETDAYRQSCPAIIEAVFSLDADPDKAGVVLDQSVFYPTGGGQPGDSGTLALDDGTEVAIQTTEKHAEFGIVHVVDSAALGQLAVSTPVTVTIDWEKRHRHMRFHSALHLLCGILPFSVTGGQIATDKARLDFDASAANTPDKQSLTEQLQTLVAASIPSQVEWTSEDVTSLVRTSGVAPPSQTGSTRILSFGTVDKQPCGGTHVANTAEIGKVFVRKIENKGKHYRRIILAIEE
ncbi:MAG: alanyl-tRNA editing protein [Alphaproteobacteria bacterium]|nr:alanyl-tRNA editing protein [Alphaproteobacteria bacterium]